MIKLKTLLDERVVNTNSTVFSIRQAALDLVDNDGFNEQTLNKTEIESIKSKINDIFDEIGDDIETANNMLRHLQVLKSKQQLTVDFLNKFILSDYGKRLLKPAADTVSKHGKPKSNHISKVQAFNDLRENHFASKGALEIFKFVVDDLMSGKYDIETINDFIELTSDPKNLIQKSDVLQPVIDTNISKLVNPKLANNQYFQQSLSTIYGLNGKGIGKGEALIMLYSANSGIAPSTKGDIVIDGVFVEIKGNGGSISTSTQKNNIDKINRDFQTNVLKLTNTEISKINTRAGKGSVVTKGTKMNIWNPVIQSKLTIDNLEQWLRMLYPNSKTFDDTTFKSMSADLLAASTRGKSQVLDTIANYVFLDYKQTHGFDSFIIISETGNIRGTATATLPNNIHVSDWVTHAGGNNQSLPWGYVNVY